MKLFSATMCLILAMISAGCKKTNTNNAYCNTCIDTLINHPWDTDSIFYYVPTAFTPNGDGLNDLYAIEYRNLIADSSTITIWDLGGKEVFSGNINSRWEGTNLTGGKCAAGNYPVHLKLMTSKGVVVNVCTCVSILQYSGSCIKTNGVTYHFDDQLNPSTGNYNNPTNETICP